MKNKIRILLIGDSFGCERFHDKNAVVLKNETWPELIKKHFYNYDNLEIESDFKTFRLLTEVIEIISKKQLKYDFIVIHAGIVDVFPRPLPKNIFRSQNILTKILRKIIGFFRIFWLKNIYAKPMHDISFLENKINILLNNFLDTKFLFVNISEQFHEEAIRTPYVDFFIDSFNEMIKVKFSEKTNFEFIDLNSYNEIKYYSSLDSHFNKEGNKLMFTLISKYIEKKCC